MKNKTIISIAVATMISCPAFATGIGASAQTADCDNSTLGTYEGSTNLQAQWTANTINLDFYDGETKLSSGTCTYDGGIELPEDPTKTGYEFDGWKVRRAAAPSQPQQTPITLSSLYDSGEIYTFAGKSLNPGVYCEGSSGWDSENDDYAWYGTDQQGATACSTDSRFSGLNNGEWTVTMPNGNIVKGTSTCSTQHPTTPWDENNDTFTPDHYSTSLTAVQYSTDNSSGIQYCWCKVTSGNTGSGFQPVSSSSWVFIYDLIDADGCAGYCVNYCAYGVLLSAAFRRAVFGVTE
jgi:uncharacterized repeat protein (TIGR02543 family)